uniref:Amino acid-binding protein n=1 Tax=Schlesneria paludicola TaxID=360056 RepID=A0A7C2NYS6_9PLAN
MAYEVKKVDTWTAELEDRPGSLNEKLGALAEAGVDLTFLIARRQPQLPGKGIVFVGGISGAKAKKAAAAAGFSQPTDVVAIRVEGRNKAGSCHALTQAIADAGITLRGAAANVIGSKFVTMLAFDTAGDADKAAKLIRALK